MAALSDADRRRALTRAAEKYELCRMIGDGNVRRGLFRMAVAERRASSAVDATATPAKAGAVEASTAPADQSKMDVEAAAPAAAGPKGRTLRRRGSRQRKRQREADAKAAAAAPPSTRVSPVGGPVDGAASVALPVWRWARGVQGRVSGHCRRRRWRMAAPTDLRWRAAAAQ